MKADMDDAPEYLRPTGRRSNRLTWVIASLLGTGITVGALHTLGSTYLQSTVNNLANHQRPKSISIAEVTRPASIPEKNWHKVVEERARRDAMSHQSKQGNSAESPPKQTVFNDLNYQPRGADNVLSLRDTYQTEEQAKPAGKVRVTVIEQAPNMKDRACWPYKEGSVERRNCRSAVGLSYRD